MVPNHYQTFIDELRNSNSKSSDKAEDKIRMGNLWRYSGEKSK
jgi:hypothetical protein